MEKKEARTLQICLAFQCVPDFKEGSFTSRTQTNLVSGAIIELRLLKKNKNKNEKQKRKKTMCDL